MENLVEVILKNSKTNSKIKQGEKEFYYQDLIDVASKIAFILEKYDSNYVVANVKSDFISIAINIAVWQSGKVYIPINLTSPSNRKDSILAQLEDYIEIIVPVDQEKTLLFNGELRQLKEKSNSINIKLESVAYIIFTSGTTGVPKGVQVTHSNLLSLLSNSNNFFNFDENDVWINLHSLEFDFSVWEVFGALYNASTLVLMDNTKLYELDTISQMIEKNGVTVLNQTPSVFYKLQDYLSFESSNKIKYIIFGGERLDIQFIEKAYDGMTKTKFVNMYGITEITIHATYHLIVKDDFLKNNISNIGKGLFFDNVFLVDENKEITKSKGEIAISGPTVSMGYLDSTKNFGKFQISSQKKIYYSGDYGEYIGDEISFIGRIDNQIEKNGYRIELDEIREAFLKFDEFENIYIDFVNEQIICYFIRSFKFEKIVFNNINKKLKDFIEEYKMPNRYIELEYIPVNTSGKVDVKKMREKLVDSSSDMNRNKDFIQWCIAVISKKVMKNESEIKVEDSFSDIGMSSLQLIEFHQDIVKSFNTDKEFKIIDVFQYVNILDLTDNFEFTLK